ncbi:MAG: hypothetical protein V4813_17940 [Gemmatimonadota bacterium]
MRGSASLLAVLTSVAVIRAPAPTIGVAYRATQVKVTVLSTMLAGDPSRGVGNGVSRVRA